MEVNTISANCIMLTSFHLHLRPRPSPTFLSSQSTFSPSPFASPVLNLSLPKRTTPRASFKYPHVLNSPAIQSASTADLGLWKTRELRVVTRAGPSVSNYIFAFVFPLSLLIVTIFTSIKIADKLDRDFLEDLAISEAMMDSDEEDGDVGISLEEEPALPRTRNRPKQEA